jgi:hypothetical protein
VVVVGETLAEPDIAPPVENPVPVQEVALVEVQVSRAGRGEEEPPLGMVAGLPEIEAVGKLLLWAGVWPGSRNARARSDTAVADPRMTARARAQVKNVFITMGSRRW